MFRALATPMLGLALLLTACSDDDNGKKDSGPTPDQQVTDQAVTDKGPGSDATPDQAPGDGPATKSVEEYVLADGDVTGWAEDASKGRGCSSNTDCALTTGQTCDTTAGVCLGADFGHSKTEIEDLIDGKHDPYAAEGCDGFVQQHYKKDFTGGCTGTLTLYIWDMTAATGAKKMFDKDKLDGETNAGLTFETLASVQTEGIIADNVPEWTAYAHKGDFLVSISAMYSDSACKADLKADTVSFLEKVTQKMP